MPLEAISPRGFAARSAVSVDINQLALDKPAGVSSSPLPTTPQPP